MAAPPRPWRTPSLPVRANGQWPWAKQPRLFPNWGRSRPRLHPHSCPHQPDVLGCSSHGTGHSCHRPLLPTNPAILLVDLDHSRSRPWPRPGPRAPLSRLSPPMTVLFAAEPVPQPNLSTPPAYLSPALGCLFPQPPGDWQPFKKAKRQRTIY